jgi:PIN domain nuclease of toxin-antitoxin system
MTRLLLDSNALIWSLYQSHRLGAKAIDTLSQAEQTYASIASVWEIAIKHNKGLISITPKQLLEGITSLGLELLSIEPSHVLHIQRVELSQKDPFDRMLVAQAQAEGCTFLTSDAHILASKYNVLDARL